MRPVTLPHKVIPQSHFCSSAKDPYPQYRIRSYALYRFSYHTVSSRNSVHFSSSGIFILIFRANVSRSSDFPGLVATQLFISERLAPIGGLRSMSSGPGYHSARAWARECEAKRPPNAGTKLSREKDPVFPQKSLSN